jgi:hypothetical protein
MNEGRFPLAPGFITGAALAGFFDGIVLHQILQWHHMICIETECIVKTVETMKQQNVYDGLFHLAMWVVLLIGLAMWSANLRTHRFVAGRNPRLKSIRGPAFDERLRFCVHHHGVDALGQAGLAEKRGSYPSDDCRADACGIEPPHHRFQRSQKVYELAPH